MTRLSTSYKNTEGFTYLDTEDLMAIEMRAKALSFDECLDFLCVDPAEVPDIELAVAKRIWRRGRCSAINLAAEKMFSAMEMRGGGAVALDYLKQLSSTFQLEAMPNSSKEGFTFNVVMPEE